ncbi:MAG TPA: hypothetical protein VD866_26795 [Urbifossiella sp.]|nr:hypothetical protein [Urbifossiella sp.]
MIGRDDGYAARLMHVARMRRKTPDPLPFQQVVGVSLGAVVLTSIVALGIAEAIGV